MPRVASSTARIQASKDETINDLSGNDSDLDTDLEMHIQSLKIVVDNFLQSREDIAHRLGSYQLYLMKLLEVQGLAEEYSPRKCSLGIVEERPSLKDGNNHAELHQYISEVKTEFEESIPVSTVVSSVNTETDHMDDVSDPIANAEKSFFVYDASTTRAKRCSHEAAIFNHLFHEKPTSGIVEGTLRAWIFHQTRWLDFIISIAILFNVGLVVHETNLRASDEEVPVVVEVLLTSLTLLFFFELLLRVYIFRCYFLQKSTNMFEAVIVLVDTGFVVMHSIHDLPSLSVLRVFRLLRVLRAVKAAKFFTELHLMLASMAAAARAIFWCTVLLLFVLMVFGIVAAMQLHSVAQEIGDQGGYGSCDTCRDSFKSVQGSMLTFTQQIIAGDSWGQVTVPMIKRSPWTAFIFFPVFIVLNFGIMNLIAAVIVDTCFEARVEKQRMVMEGKYEETQVKLVELFTELDTDCSGSLSLGEAFKGMQDRSSEFAKFIKTMGISLRDVEMIFQVLDEDGSGAVDLEEFVEGLYRMKLDSDRTLLLLIRQYTDESRLKAREHSQLLSRLHHDMKKIFRLLTSHDNKKQTS